MSFDLEPGESFAENIRRIVGEQIDEALRHLEDERDDPDEGVHDARVCIKKIRAVLRLVRHSLGHELYTAEDKSYRDAARLLAKVRESAALLETLDLLDEKANGKDLNKTIQTLRDAFNKTHKASEVERLAAMTQAADSLCEAKERLRSWPDVTHHPSLSKGLKRVFKQGRVRFEGAYELESVEAFHEWRKSVKQLLHLVRVLRPVWPSMLRALGKDLKQLGKLLSEDHDLAMLKGKIVDHYLVALIDERRREVQRSARSLGARIYADKPRAFVKRLETSFQLFTRESQR